MENMASYSALGEYGLWKKFEIWRGEAEPNFKFFHNPYSPSAEYEAIFSITRHQPGGICTKNVPFCMFFSQFFTVFSSFDFFLQFE